MIMDLVGHSATAVVAEAEAAMIAIPPSEELLGFALRDANDGCRVVRAGRHPLRLETSTLECGHLKCMYVYVAAFKCMCMRMRMRMCICMCIETSSLGCGHGARQHLVGARSMAELAAAARAPAEDLVRTGEGEGVPRAACEGRHLRVSVRKKREREGEGDGEGDG